MTERLESLNVSGQTQRPHATAAPALFSSVNNVRGKLQALVYDILPSITAVFSGYAIGSRKLSANEQVFFLVLKQ